MLLHCTYPRSAPWISANPVLCSSLRVNAPTSHRDDVVNLCTQHKRQLIAVVQYTLAVQQGWPGWTQYHIYHRNRTNSFMMDYWVSVPLWTRHLNTCLSNLYLRWYCTISHLMTQTIITAQMASTEWQRECVCVSSNGCLRHTCLGITAIRHILLKSAIEKSSYLLTIHF